MAQCGQNNDGVVEVIESHLEFGRVATPLVRHSTKTTWVFSVSVEGHNAQSKVHLRKQWPGRWWIFWLVSLNSFERPLYWWMSSAFGKKCKKLFFEKPIVLQKVLFLHCLNLHFRPTPLLINFLYLRQWAFFQCGKEFRVCNGILWHSNESVIFQPIFDIFWQKNTNNAFYWISMHALFPIAAHWINFEHFPKNWYLDGKMQPF